MKQLLTLKKLLLFSIFLFGFSEKIITDGSITGYFELTEKYYPKTVAYFDKLRQKYPALENIPIHILAGPFADNDTIYFPMEWIEELEKGNKFYFKATEWIVLHEAGHIIHNDVIKQALTIYGISAAFLIYYYKSIINLFDKYRHVSFLDNSVIFKIQSPTDQALIQNNLQSKCEKNSNIIWAAAAAGISIYALQTYMLATREYVADDFAMKHCDNPQAWIAAYEWIDRHALLGFLPGISHSFTKYRLERISKAFQQKFGYELVIFPQSLDPEYVTE